MAVDEELNTRMRMALAGQDGISERKMMGGVCFLLNGHMVSGADKDKHTGERRFMFRVGKANDGRAADLPGGDVMVVGGRRMSGLYFVNAETCKDTDFDAWLALAVEHAKSLPPKLANRQTQ